MKIFLGSKLMCVLSLSMISVLYSANAVQADAWCCCCNGFPFCEPKTESCNTQCFGGWQTSTCPQRSCTDYCLSMANEDTTIIESFMPEEYIDEVIAMDADCTAEVDETADVSAEQ